MERRQWSTLQRVHRDSGEPRHSHSNKPNEDHHRKRSTRSITTSNPMQETLKINKECTQWVSLWWDEECVMMQKGQSNSITNNSTDIHTLHGTHTHKQSHWKLPLVSTKIVEFSNFPLASETQAWRGIFIRRSRMDRASYWKGSRPWRCGGIMWCVYKRIYRIHWFHDCLCFIHWSINCEIYHLHLFDVITVSLSVSIAIILLSYPFACDSVQNDCILVCSVVIDVCSSCSQIRWTNECSHSLNEQLRTGLLR